MVGLGQELCLLCCSFSLPLRPRLASHHHCLFSALGSRQDSFTNFQQRGLITLWSLRSDLEKTEGTKVKYYVKLFMTVLICNLRTQGAEAEDYQLEGSLVFIACDPLNKPKYYYNY